jgi:hypothetical protein
MKCQPPEQVKKGAEKLDGILSLLGGRPSVQKALFSRFHDYIRPSLQRMMKEGAAPEDWWKRLQKDNPAGVFTAHSSQLVPVGRGLGPGDSITGPAQL